MFEKSGQWRDNPLHKEEIHPHITLKTKFQVSHYSWMQHKSPTLEQSRKRKLPCEEDESGEEVSGGLFNDFFRFVLVSKFT